MLESSLRHSRDFDFDPGSRVLQELDHFTWEVSRGLVGTDEEGPVRDEFALSYDEVGWM